MRHRTFTLFTLVAFILILISLACGKKKKDKNLFLAGAGIATVPGVSVYFYVAPGGNDSNLGNSSSVPLATLEGARDAVRQYKADNGSVPAGGIVVWLRGGVYERTSTFNLYTQDSGEAGKPIVYIAYPGESVRIVGGIKLDPADFSTVTASSVPDVWNRFDDSAKGNVMQVNLAAYTNDYGTFKVRGFGFWGDTINALELFYNGAPMQIGRWPDKVEPADAVDETSGFELVATTDGDTIFTYSDNRPSRWGLAEEIWVHGYWRYWWAAEHTSVASLDSGTKTVTLSSTPGYGITEGQPFYAYNLLEEITVPG